jgi:hypothetical protein
MNPSLVKLNPYRFSFLEFGEGDFRACIQSDEGFILEDQRCPPLRDTHGVPDAICITNRTLSPAGLTD